MHAIRAKTRRHSSWPFILTLLSISILTTCAFLLRLPTALADRDHGSSLDVRAATAEPECRAVRDAPDQCAFVLAHCEDDEAGLIHYLTFYYCTLGRAKPVAFVLLTIWLGLLFTTIGTAASEFFSVNLSTIATKLHLSESLAGVTFLAFGNGSPDVFSTFAAMRSNSGSMAIGELIGAAGFITAVVAGSIALYCEFKVSKRTFVRDIVFFIAAISFAIVFLRDGALHLWECFTMIGFYAFYVFVVVGWHWLSVRRRRQKRKEIAARTSVIATGGPGGELEPYRDLPEEDDGIVGGRSSSAPEAPDVSVLERGPRIEIDGRGVPPQSPEEDEERDVHVLAEMTSHMRATRPRWGRSNTTITPTRPSLMGALEFRSVLLSLSKERNMHLGPIPDRMYSDHAHQLAGALEQSTVSLQEPSGQGHGGGSSAQPHPSSRERALSHGNTPLNLGNPALPIPEIVPDSPTPGVGRTTSSTIDGRLAPPGPAVDHGSRSYSPSHSPRAEPPRLQIPPLSRRSSGRSSPSLSPFPGLTESPGVLTPLPPQDEPTAFTFPIPSDRRLSSARPIDDAEGQPKPIKWWPYRFLPAPHILLNTLFPTLQGWTEKPLWAKALSVISAPSIFLLVTTLPVVETDSGGDELEDNVAAAAAAALQPRSSLPPVSAQNGTAAEQETVWQEFRRRTRSVSSRSARSLSPQILPIDSPSHDRNGATITIPPIVKPNAVPAPDFETSTTDQDAGWNRWLVGLQTVTGPLFLVFITWANAYDEVEDSSDTLVRWAIYSLIVSCGLLAALFLFTSADEKPKYHAVLCVPGFVISVAWISTIAGEVVGVLKAFGVISGISEAILGLTIFAVGNSVGDLVADVTMAKLGFPVMALSACFGGPMLNILLGVGIGGAWMGIESANAKHRKHPDRPLHYKPYRIQVSGTLMISAVTVLLTLVTLLVAVPMNKWTMSRKIGWTLIAIWAIGTGINLWVDLRGGWSDES